MRSFALSSGSSANCFYVESENNKTKIADLAYPNPKGWGVTPKSDSRFVDHSLEYSFHLHPKRWSIQRNKVLVDLGLSFTKTKDILSLRNIDINTITEIFITHEHADHVVGLNKFLKELKCNFYMSAGTFDALKVKDSKIKIVKEHDLISFDSLKVFIVSKPHDSLEPISFVFEEKGFKLGIFTDLGHVTNEIAHIIKSLNIIYFEVNYCHEIILKKDLNYTYVNRLVSDTGHLGVKQSCDILSSTVKDDQKIILSHISENTNSYENAYLKIKTFLESCGKFPEILVSFQGEPTEWVE